MKLTTFFISKTEQVYVKNKCSWKKIKKRRCYLEYFSKCCFRQQLTFAYKDLSCQITARGNCYFVLLIHIHVKLIKCRRYFLAKLVKKPFIRPIFLNSVHIRYLFLLIFAIRAKGKKAVTNSGYTSICFTIKQKMLLDHFWYFHCSNFIIPFGINFMKKLQFFNFFQISTMLQNTRSFVISNTFFQLSLRVAKLFHELSFECLLCVA